MLRRITLLVVVCSVLGTTPGVALETVGRGDFEFFLGTSAFRQADGEALQEFYIRVSNPHLRFKESNKRIESRTQFTFAIRNGAGERVVNEETEIRFYAADEKATQSPRQFQTITKKYNLPAGRYSLSCKILDKNAPKVTIIGMIRSKYNQALVTDFDFVVPKFADDTMSLSGAKFLWEIKAAGSELVYHPNPARLYGLYKDSLIVYMEAYVPEVISKEGDLQVTSVILDETGEVVRQATVPLPERDSDRGLVAKYPLVITEDLNEFPAGNYTLYVNAGHSDQLLVRVRCGSFSVAWDMRTWELSRRDFLAEARFLLGDEEFEAFQRKGIGEQESELQAMWKKLDPDPLTGINEAYEEFLARLDYINGRYSDYQLGMFTDRGLIYLKYGPPDEMIVDVVPLNRESISDALEKVEDRYHSVNFSNTGGRIGYAQPSRNIIIDPRRLGQVGEGGDTAYPYELWVYNGNGKPLLEADHTLESNIGLRFIFIDRQGYGRYKLESSSSLVNQ